LDESHKVYSLVAYIVINVMRKLYQNLNTSNATTWMLEMRLLSGRH